MTAENYKKKLDSLEENEYNSYTRNEKARNKIYNREDLSERFEVLKKFLFDYKDI